VTTDSTVNRAMPNACVVKAVSDGIWQVVFNTAADQAYSLWMQYQITPDEVDDDEVPWYPNDRTMQQFVEVQAYKHLKQWQVYRIENDILAEMVISDRAKYGVVDGSNDSLFLDPNIFK
jgi:hypothetical protein